MNLFNLFEHAIARLYRWLSQDRPAVKQHTSIPSAGESEPLEFKGNSEHIPGITNSPTGAPVIIVVMPDRLSGNPKPVESKMIEQEPPEKSDWLKQLDRNRRKM